MSLIRAGLSVGGGHGLFARTSTRPDRLGELVNNNNGGGPAPSINVYEGTIGLSSPWAGHYELRVELRGDFASEDIFMTGPEPDGEAAGNQFTGTIAALAYF